MPFTFLGKQTGIGTEIPVIQRAAIRDQQRSNFFKVFQMTQARFDRERHSSPDSGLIVDHEMIKYFD